MLYHNNYFQVYFFRVVPELVGWNKYSTDLKKYNDANSIVNKGSQSAVGKNEIGPKNPEKPESGKNNISINISFGTSKSVSETNSNTVMGQGSNISAGGDVNIKARDKDLTIKGSTIDGENITLQAAGNVNIEASSNTNVSKTDSKSSSSSIGVGINLGSGGITGTLEISKSKGNILENGTTWNESVINANGTLVIESGKDLNIIGSQVKGETVKIDVGENLNIESLQDTNNYKEKQTSGGISLSVGPGPNALSGSGNASNQKIESEYTSVKEQAGIFAGEGGFDINVGGNTDLIGSVIASEADASENKISTETITFSDLENHAEWSANTTGVNVNLGKDVADKDKGVTPNIAGSDDEANSTTHSAISEGEIEIRDKDKQEQDIEELSRDTENANNPLEPIFDRDKILERQEAAAIFGELGFTVVGEIISRSGWDRDDPRSIALHALIGGIMAEINNGEFGEGMTVGAINKLITAKLQESGIMTGTDLRLVSALLGQIINGNAGSNIADSATRNNALQNAPIIKDLVKYMQGQTHTLENNQLLIVNVTYGNITYTFALDKNNEFFEGGSIGIGLGGPVNITYSVITINTISNKEYNFEELKKNATGFSPNANIDLYGLHLSGTISVTDNGSGYGVAITSTEKGFGAIPNIGIGLGSISHQGNSEDQGFFNPLVYKNNYFLGKYLEKNPTGDYEKYITKNGVMMLIRTENGRRQMWQSTNGEKGHWVSPNHTPSKEKIDNELGWKKV